MEDFATLYFDTIPQAMRLLRSQMRSEAKQYLSVPQFRILVALHRGHRGINEIAQIQGVSQPAMSRMVDGLVQRGLVKRDVDPNDRRCAVLGFTTKGKNLFLKIRKKAAQNMKKLVAESGVDPKPLIQSLEQLRFFIENLEGRE